jgi:uncharacterized membrane protein YphA (DoxX/SURF4 family)
MAIGWHLHYEGKTKLDSLETEKPFSAEGYLRNATGPFAGTFRNMVPDVDSLIALDLENFKRQADEDLERVALHYQFDPDQRTAAKGLVIAAQEKASQWFADDENRDKLRKYEEHVMKVRGLDANPPRLKYERERLDDERKKLESERRELVGPLNSWTSELRTGLVALAKPDQIQTMGKYTAPPTELDGVNRMTMYGLYFLGLFLMLGFLTPLSALLAAGLVFTFYISNPPFPGLPAAPNAEGSYLFVNKNLIEILALLVIASTPSGLWIGFDSILFGWIGRRGQSRSAATSPETA